MGFELLDHHLLEFEGVEDLVDQFNGNRVLSDVLLHLARVLAVVFGSLLDGVAEVVLK